MFVVYLEMLSPSRGMYMSSNGLPVLVKSGNQGTVPAFACRCVYVCAVKVYRGNGGKGSTYSSCRH